MRFFQKILISIFICFFILNGKLESNNSDKNIPVVIIHGILSNPLIMKPLENKFQDAGYETYNYGYHSTENNIRQQGIDFAEWLNENIQYGKFYLVSHSMGNLVGREMENYDSTLQIIRWVMIAPPNHGSEYADTLDNIFFYKWITKTPGQELLATSDAHFKSLSPPDCEFGIIAGGKKNNKGYNPFIDADNDGEVRVDEAYLKGAEDFIILKHAHTPMLFYEDTFKQCLYFIENGCFNRDTDYTN
ncbi:MAG: hypothetical protein U9R41_07250 [Candidatus Marinimicrobia bacterium]|nr:hypothetical protein [Candidatus Neomarinimicrobiota bacterium]